MANTLQEVNYQYFMETNLDMYINEWVAILEDKIISHGRYLKQVAEEAQKKSNGKKFLLAKIPTEEEIIL